MKSKNIENNAEQISFTENLRKETEDILLKKLGKKIEVDPLPQALSETNLKKATKFNLRPVFSPGENFFRELYGAKYSFLFKRVPEDWIEMWYLPEDVKKGDISIDHIIWPRGWYLVDFTIGVVNFRNQSPEYKNDPLSPIIENLRTKGKIGGYSNMPKGSRFGIIPESEWPLVIFAMEIELPFLTKGSGSLESCAAFNAIGNIYDTNRKEIAPSEWFSNRPHDLNLCSGSGRNFAWVGPYSGTSCERSNSTAGRPMWKF